MVGVGFVDTPRSFSYPKPNTYSNMPVEATVNPYMPTSYTRMLEQMARLYPYDPAAVAASISALGYSYPHQRQWVAPEKSKEDMTTDVKEENEDYDTDKALDLTVAQNIKSGKQSPYQRISLNHVKPKIVEDVWVENDVQLMWTDSKVAAYNPAQKVFMCLDCECVGFLSRVAEHWLGAHANLRVFHCPRCPYTSAWSRCVKMHLTRQHSEQFADTTMWKGNATLLEVTRLMQELRTKVEAKIDANSLLTDKRFYCPYCPYATDRRDLYTRHENIHKDDKPFHCYICFKQFNRADHVKKHFVRMHADAEYDITKIRKNQTTANNATKSSTNTNVSASKSTLSDTNFSDTAEKSSKKSSKKLEAPSPISVDPAYNQPTVPNPINLSFGNSTSVKLVDGSVISNESSQSEGSNRKRKGDKAYTCHYCHWSGSDNWCLKRHMNTHIKPFACIMCDYKAARAERLSTHVWKVHNKRICNKCNFLADTQERLLEHTREEHHNNPYSRRHICSICGLSFDTRANLETHVHLSHTRPKSPNDVAEITPILLPIKAPSVQDSAENLSFKKIIFTEEEATSLICPVETCNFPCTSSGLLADHVRRNHGGLFAFRCPHCGYNLTQDELSKDHWLTHHEDVCCACVHVFTSVYGPQLWKKVHGGVRSSDSPLNAIVTDLNKKRANSPSEEMDPPEQSSSGELCLTENLNCLLRVPFPMADDGEVEKNAKRQRKQSSPKKLITMPVDLPTSDAEEKSETSLLESANALWRRKLKRNIKKLKRKRCMKCPHRPTFSSYARFRTHRFKRHRLITKSFTRKRSALRSTNS